MEFSTNYYCLKIFYSEMLLVHDLVALVEIFWRFMWFSRGMIAKLSTSFVCAVIFRVSRDWIIPLRLLIHTKSLSLFMCLILSSQDIASHHQKQQHIVTRNPNPYNHSPWHSSLVSCTLLTVPPNWLSNSWSDSFVLIIYFENQKGIMKFLLSNTMLMSSSFFSCICLAYIAILPPAIKGDSEDNCKSIGMFLIFFFFVSCRTD